ncbi:hypothetical protein OPW32_03195 [Vibrio europaeus]|uniref:hypothetical protein n=1 Tax=Vibrio europaeus TaxID=300876 RepID=UPI0023409AB8|nr:hypothetical protein [Vibrio europaeus]MDC5848211.1 hypothetical protein [Vibrio europaeus]
MFLFIKFRDLIWPDEIFSNSAKVVFVALLLIIWIFTGVYKYWLLDGINIVHLTSVIFVFLLICFLFNRDMPLSSALEFVPKNYSNQIGRALLALVCLVAYIYSIASSDYS